MQRKEAIDYQLAQTYFQEAESSGNKLTTGSLETNVWLHREKINLDFVIETAKQLPDSRIFIIASGPHKGFYLYSTKNMSCFKIVATSERISKVQAI